MFVIIEFVVRGLYKDETVLFPRYHTDARYGEFSLLKMRPNSEFWHTSIDGSWKIKIVVDIPAIKKESEMES